MWAFVVVDLGSPGTGTLFIAVLAAGTRIPLVVVDFVLLAEVRYLAWWQVAVGFPGVFISPVAMPSYVIPSVIRGLH